MDKENFYQSLEEMKIFLTEEQKNAFERYYQLLIEWNEKMNLTGITDKNLVYLKHFYDSASLCRVIDLKQVETLCDVGTGAGFPGIVLKILFPHLHLTLLDSLGKRLQFLQVVSESLELSNVTFLSIRAEEYAKKHREVFDVVTARAVAPLSHLLEYCIPLVKKNGYFLPLKGNVEEELKNISSINQKLDCSLLVVDRFSLPFENSERSILKFQKISFTTIKYPRNYSEMKKNPLS